MSDERNEVKPFDDKLKTWLGEQGYPTEFRTANICRRHGFRAWQGFHVRDEQSPTPREIDVVASIDYPRDGSLIRIEHVFECKWSKDKPWIVFTSTNSRIAPSACAAQTIGDLLASAAIWAVAGDPQLHALDYFCTPDRPGYGGRQAFSKGQDQFYSALAAVADLSFLLANRDQRIQKPYYTMPDHAVLAFPIVVVEGRLYEAYFDNKLNDVRLEERKRVRCHWRGAASWDFHTTIDVVALDYLDEFMSVRSQESRLLLQRVHDAVAEIEECFKKQTLTSLKVTSGPRGMVGLPPLLVDLRMLDQIRNAKRKRKSKSRKTK